STIHALPHFPTPKLQNSKTPKLRSRPDAPRSPRCNDSTIQRFNVPTLRRSHAPRSHAFTLLELLVVIGIIALISAIAIPSFTALKPNLLAVASRQMLDDLSWA